MLKVLGSNVCNVNKVCFKNKIKFKEYFEKYNINLFLNINYLIRIL